MDRQSFLPITSWPLNLRSRVDLVRFFKKLSGPLISAVEDYQLSLLDLLPPIPSELIQILENPARLWSCSLSCDEFLLADHVEMKQHYAYGWLVPLWLARYDYDTKQVDEIKPQLIKARTKKPFWNCHTGTQIELNLDSYLSSGRQLAEFGLVDVVLTFGGASFVKPMFALPNHFNVFDHRSTADDSADSTTSISATAGLIAPSPTPQDLVDLVTRAEASANLRSPFLTKDSVKPSDPVPRHVGSATFAPSQFK